VRREWIERGRRSGAEKHQCNHQAVTVREGQEDEQHGERAAAVSKIRRGPIRPPRYTVNGPITSGRHPRHCQSMRFRRTRIHEVPGNRACKKIMRLVSVDDSAPVTTPRIPSSGGPKPPQAPRRLLRARYLSEMGDCTLETAILFGYAWSGRCNHRESGTQFGGKGAIVQPNLNGDALYHLVQIAGRVVGR